MQDSENLLKILLEHNIEFVIIGGLAAILHGSSYVTQDLDICAPLSAEQIKKIRECLADYHPTHRMTSKPLSFLEFPEKISNLKNIYLKTDLGLLDILGQVAGLGDFEKVAKNAVEIDLYGRKCKVISIKDLIVTKEIMGREKDRAILHELKAILSKIKT